MGRSCNGRNMVIMKKSILIAGAVLASTIQGCAYYDLFNPPGRCTDAHAIKQLYEEARKVTAQEGVPPEFSQYPLGMVTVKYVDEMHSNPEYNCKGTITVVFSTFNKGYTFPMYYLYSGDKIEKVDIGITKFQRQALRDLMAGKNLVRNTPVIPNILR